MTATHNDMGGLGAMGCPLTTPQHHAAGSPPVGAPSTPGDGHAAWPSTTT